MLTPLPGNSCDRLVLCSCYHVLIFRMEPIPSGTVRQVSFFRVFYHGNRKENNTEIVTRSGDIVVISLTLELICGKHVE